MSWRWEVKLVNGKTIEVVADDVELSNGFFDFTNSVTVKLVRERTIRRGVWPYTRLETVREDQHRHETHWVTTVQADYVLQLTPLEEASAIEAHSDATGTGAAEGESAVGESRDAHD